MDRPHQHPRPHKPYLYQRWAEGCTVARRLFEEIREHGYTGGESVVKKYVARLREAFPLDPPRKAPSVRDVTGWLTLHPDRLTDDQEVYSRGSPAFLVEGEGGDGLGDEGEVGEGA
ncbi:hypothetical protein AB0D37_43590, partial [Streptomyces sp. NPDC048384]